MTTAELRQENYDIFQHLAKTCMPSNLIELIESDTITKITCTTQHHITSGIPYGGNRETVMLERSEASQGGVN